MKLNIEIPFTDKLNGKHYRVGDVIEFEESRATELLADKRKLVSKNEEPKIEKPKAAKRNVEN